ncbi:unnamed protein product [Auanema sp. JU1783]|nr:unnamed protein product [Auanema sp. JU1783]
MGANSSSIEYSPVRQTTSGQIRGRAFHLPEDKNRVVDGYLGIPYAQPPIGKYRFKKPVEAAQWSEVKDCLHFGPRCPQTDDYFAQYINIVGKDEANCLTLNVIAPRWKSEEWPKGLPVMVWIHGGGFAIHSSSNYGAATVARNLCVKDVLFVSINYRLGVFGFFSTATEECSGNMGLWDQTLALQWVQNNIAEFGGDPTNVTIFGQSAGGASVDLLTLSPHSNHLFKRVIPMSGCGECDFAFRTKEGQAKLSIEFARYLGWRGEDDDDKGLMEWMVRQPTTRLEVGINAKKGFRHSQAGNLYFVPTYDGDFFPKPPSVLRTEIPQKDVMTGVTQNEGLFFVALGGFHKSFEGIKRFLGRIFRECDYGSEATTIQKELYEFYTKDVDPKDKATISRRMVELFGDYAINVGTYNYANKMSKCGHNVYLYNFEYFNPDGFGLFRFIFPFRGATHCTEIRYILGKGIYSKFKPNEEDHRMIQMMTEYFSNFAKYGNPNGLTDGTNDLWEKHSQADSFRYFNIQLPKSHMANDFQNRRAEFWNSAVGPKNKTKSNL